MIPNDPRTVDKNMQKTLSNHEFIEPISKPRGNHQAVAPHRRRDSNDLMRQKCQCPGLPSNANPRPGPQPTVLEILVLIFFPSPHVIEAGKIDANMTSEGHHFSVACQILLLWAQPGPGVQNHLWNFGVRSSSSVMHIVGVLLQLLQGFGGRAVARVGGVLKQLNGDVFVISSRIRNKGREVQTELEKLESDSGIKRIALQSLIKASCLEVISTQVAHAQLVQGLWHGIGKDLWQSKDSSSQSVFAQL